MMIICYQEECHKPVTLGQGKVFIGFYNTKASRLDSVKVVSVLMSHCTS